MHRVSICFLSLILFPPGAINAENGLENTVTNQVTGMSGTVPEVARQYQKAGTPWVVIAEKNYGSLPSSSFPLVYYNNVFVYR